MELLVAKRGTTGAFFLVANKVPMTKKWNKLRNAVRDALDGRASEQQRIAYEKFLYADKLLEGTKLIKKAKDLAGNYSQKIIVDALSCSTRSARQEIWQPKVRRAPVDSTRSPQGRPRRAAVGPARETQRRHHQRQSRNRRRSKERRRKKDLGKPTDPRKVRLSTTKIPKK